MNSGASATLIQGQVLDEQGQPVAGARLAWVDSPLPMPDVALLSDAQGRFSLALPAPGNYQLRCDADTAGSAVVAVQARGGTLKLVCRLSPRS